MAVTPYVGDFLTVSLKPDFVADTLAEVDGNLATYANKYVQVKDQSDHIFYVEDLENGSYLRREAYEFSNYVASNDTSGTGSVFVGGVTEPVVVGDAVWFKDAGDGCLELWVQDDG